MNLKEQFGRLVVIARLIKEKPGEWDVPGLAVELDISESTVHRDIQILRNYGQIHKLRGKGYVIERFEIPLERLGLEEVMALTIGGHMMARHLGSPFADAIHSALRKIGEHLPEELEDVLERVEERFSIGLPTTRDYSRHGNIFRALNEAILRHHPILITYFTMTRQSLGERRIDPYCITFRRGGWYVIGYCHLRKEVRTFGIHRIRKAKILRSERFKFPEGFDAESYLAGSWQIINDGPPRRVLVRFSKVIAPWILEGNWHSSQKMTKEPDGSVLFEANVSGMLELKRWILAYGGDAEVLEPEELRVEVKKDVNAMIRKYR